jgi:hypothetical protein
MKYIIRTLRILVLVLLFPLILVVFFAGLVIMPLVYGTICIYFYIKDGNNYNSKNSDYYTEVVFHFFMDGIWVWTIKHILKLE